MKLAPTHVHGLVPVVKRAVATRGMDETEVGIAGYNGQDPEVINCRIASRKCFGIPKEPFKESESYVRFLLI